MAHMMDTENHSQEGSTCTLTYSDVMALDLPDAVLAVLTDEIRAEVAQAAMDAWGFSGVAVRHGAHDDWAGVALVSPVVPRGHPLSAADLSEDTAGLILVLTDSASSVGVGKRLCTGLSRRLHNQASGIEAQGNPLGMAPFAPSTNWLAHMGFEPMRYPPNRYRLDFSSMVAWVQKRLAWHPHPAFALQGQAATCTVERTRES